jgi:hypothetical protein
MQRKVRLAQYSEYTRAQLGGDKSRADLRRGLDDHCRLVSKLDPLPMHACSSPYEQVATDRNSHPPRRNRIDQTFAICHIVERSYEK